MEIKKVKIGSFWKIFPLLFFGLGMLVGGLSIITLQSLPGQPPGMMRVGFFGGMLATIIYALFFSIISSIIVVAVGLLYNMIASWWGGIVISTETKLRDPLNNK
ncbi:MAG: hypothetical protein JXJ19_01740 [Elusimicrobia bacterium]|nr:hypothetical protein [Elusimicrobiota bacterium]